jgi:colanic acid/amylovoran biosynthesis glycosyltransferase
MGTLFLLMSLPGFEPAPNQVRLTKKLLEGVKEYAKHWPGKVTLMMPPGEMHSGNLDDIIIERSSLPFTVDILDFASADLREKIADAGLVLGGSHPAISGLAKHCKIRDIPYIFVTEYTLKTRLQILKTEVKNPFKLLRRTIWELREEYRTLSKVKYASGIQCNGTPTFDAYQHHNKEALLYFDNRIDTELLSSIGKITEKCTSRSLEKPMQLAFSGRLNRMKGAHQLIPIAQRLCAKKLPFHLHIFGEGPLSTDIATAIQKNKLEHCVTYHGTVDFREHLVPFISKNIDIFICPHLQGDPSCTYIETFACGVPILGFANEALSGILKIHPCGWSAPIGNIEKIVSQLELLYRDPQEIERAAKSALEFATENTFAITFSKRISQMIKLSKQS